MKLKEVDYISDEVEPERYSGVPLNLVLVGKLKNLNRRLAGKLIRLGKLFQNLDWAKGTSGNLSCRDKNSVIISATKASLGNLEGKLVRVVEVDMKTSPPTVYYESSFGEKPTSEVLAHWVVYNEKPKANVVLHGHDRLTTKRAPLLARYAPHLVGRTNKPYVQGTKEFALSLRGLLCSKSYNDRVYLIVSGHGFFSLGSCFKEALTYAEWAHRAVRWSKNLGLINLRYSEEIDQRLHPSLRGKARFFTSKFDDRFKNLVRNSESKLNRFINPLMRKFKF